LAQFYGHERFGHGKRLRSFTVPAADCPIIVPVAAAPQAAGAKPRGKLLLEWRAAGSPVRQKRRITMKNPLDSIWGTIISGLVLTVILYYAVKSMLM
jgi:hypothetical protein